MRETRSELRRLPWRLRYEHLARMGSEWRKLMVRVTHRHCRVQFLGPVRLGPGFALHIPDHGSLVVGPHVEFRRGFVCEIAQSGLVEIGAHSVFTRDALLQCTTSIRIGEHCQFGQALMIVDGNHRYRDPEKPVREQGYDFRPITIGRDVMVLAKVTIVASIGERAVIGANSVVIRDIPPYSLAAGSPAVVRDYFGPPERPAEPDRR